MINSIPLYTLFKGLEQLDSVRLNFSPQGITLMNIIIAFIMFGVALGIKPSHFKDVFLNPRAVIVGLISQYVLLPAMTFGLVWILKPTPTVALGMILVAACPGGNISNFISSMAKANVALSVSLTAISTVVCLFMTPLNFAIWGGLYAKNSPLLVPLEIDPMQMFYTVVILLGIPVALGMFISSKFPNFTLKIIKYVKYASIFAFVGFIIGSFAANFTHFINYINLIFLIVLIHNASALFVGYMFPWALRLKQNDCRTISIETGIQNSGLGLALIFNPKIFPPELELGGMAFIAAWWGIWHVISGFIIATLWSKRRLRDIKLD
ncbi:bile acid:sodium symporter family protein [Odoribacter sp. OttesenSCG-928-L07]|nr:bile acid:sodium symporter family protein [Odoribacter sp. OttesenSCG-928-L07]